MTRVLTVLAVLVAPLVRRGLPRLALALMALAGSAAALAVSTAVVAAGRGLVAVRPDAGTGATAAVLLGLLAAVATVAAALLAMAGKAGLAVFAVLTPWAACADFVARHRAGPRRLVPAQPVMRQVPRGGP
ncbi:hypothetical protein ACIQF5_21825 [Streptomyces goshikiensis]|uniref:hypothetical protein n=1 Tax=Streptomyces goshikiensis TaxID=1942 RepID=UPI00381DC754